MFEADIGCEVFLDEAKTEKSDRSPTKKYDLHISLRNSFLFSIHFDRCDCPQKVNKNESKVKFSTDMMDFGVVPIGLKIERRISIQKTTLQDVHWIIKEIIYDIDMKPSMYAARDSCLDKSEGMLTDQVFTVKYTIDTKVSKTVD